MRTYSIVLAVLSAMYAVAMLPQRSEEDLAHRGYDLLLSGETPAAVECFRTLVSRNPASPYTWATLAEALAQSGDRTGASEAMNQAVQRGPAIPQVRIRAANLFAELDDKDAAAQSLAAVLSVTPAYDSVVFDSFGRIGLSPREIHETLGGNRRAARAWFYEVRQHGSPQDLAITWDWLLARGYIDKAMSASYLEVFPKTLHRW